MASGVRLRARWRLMRGAVKSLLWLLAAVVLAVLFVLRTGLGHQAVLGWVLNQGRAQVDGRIEVDRIRSANLLRGARLGGVRLLTPDGELLLSVDSLELSYGLRSLIQGDLAFSDVELWGPHLNLTQTPSQEASTFGRWLGQRPPGADGGGTGPTVVLEDVRIHGGSVHVTTPLASPADTLGRLRWESTPEGPVRVVDVEGIDASLSRVAVGGDEAALEARVTAAALEARVLAEPVSVAHMQGDVRLAADTLTVTMDRATVDGAGVEGRVRLVPPPSGEGRTVELDLLIQEFDLVRYGWLVDRLPALAGTVRLAGTVGPAGQRWSFSELDAGLDGGRIRGSGAVGLDDGLLLDGLDLALEGVPLAVVEPYLPGDSLPVRGRVSGSLRVSGPSTGPTVVGRLRLVPEGYPVAVGDVEGTLLLPPGGPVGFRGFRVTLDTLDWALVGAVLPSVRLTGPGTADVVATGDLVDGLRFDANVAHMPPEGVASHVLASGSVRRTGDQFAVDVQGDLSPLSFTALRAGYPSLPLSGEVAGAVRARGLLDDLEVRAEVETELGRMDLLGRVNARDPASGYRMEGTVQDFLASGLVPALPDPSRFSGWVEVTGSGLAPGDIRADARLELGASRVDGLTVDTVHLAARIRDGVLLLDTLTGRAAGFSVEAAGTLAVDSLRPSGEIVVAFATQSLVGVRPLFMGEAVIAADTLGALERELLRLEGIDPDTLPLLADVAMSGTAQGRVTLSGSVSDFTARGEVDLRDVQYGASRVASATVSGEAAGLPGLAGRITLVADLVEARVLGRSFSEGHAELDFARPEGTALVELRRSDDEDYRARASFEVDSLGGRVALEELALRFDTLSYQLATPASLAWNDSSVHVRDFELVSPGSDPLSIRAEGILPRRGQADFSVVGRGVRLERLIQLVQREDLELAGRVDLDVTIGGTAASPVINGTVSGQELRAKTVELSRFQGEVDYADTEARIAFLAWRDDLSVLEVSGTVPVDLALQSVPDRTPERDMDLRVRADSLPAVFVLTLLEDLEDVQGTISGELTVAGTPDDPEPRGTLRIVGGAWTVAALGVRQSSVDGTLDVQPDGVVAVRATGRAGGGAVDVDGTVTLRPLVDPGLELTIRLDRFQAVNRRDVEGRVSGEIQLTQRFRRPVITGDLRVDEGILYLEEFQRSAGVVDLSDPRFYAYVDTSLLSGRPLLAETRNPFMDSLRVNIDLDVGRGTWLRSPQMNVEIGGNLIVTYDRAAKDIVMIGELEAIRGQYTFLSRAFDVRSGTVEFVGTPGLDPNLDIQAAARVRRREADPLVITANLSGTLVDPRVRLTGEDGSIPESDLISYLVFGRPSSEVNSLFSRGGGSGGDMGDGLLGEGFSFLSSTLASSLASLAQGVGWFDYLSVSQAADVSASTGGLSPFAGTQVEIGQYFLGGDYFAALTLRPLSGAGRSGNILGGFRLEWQASDQYHLEVFAEDRFLRGGGFGFQELGIRSSLIYGFSFVREWGY